MALKTNKKDKTNSLRQARRRIREKEWLKENGWRSWEALHTALMNGLIYVGYVDLKSSNSKLLQINSTDLE